MHEQHPDAPTLSDGRYILTQRLGEGGMASVFLGWDTKLKVWRALKVLLPAIAKKPKLRKRFENEAHAMARLEHPNIVRVYDVGLHGDTPFMVMELAEQGCVIDWLHTHGPMPPRLAVEVAIQICAGIHAAHEIGIVHRDIKPHNVLINRKGKCKVTDFGIAQVMDIDTLTKTGSVMGTWGFMAPEQRADAKNVDDRADIFSVGATLYNLLTNKTPTELYVADVDDDIFDGIPPDLLQIVLTACAYKPAKRYANILALSKALEDALPDQPLTPSTTPTLRMGMLQLPDSVESAPLSATIVEELREALGEDDPPPPAQPSPFSTNPPAGPISENPSQSVLPYYMPKKPAPSLPELSSPRIEPPTSLPAYIDAADYKRQVTKERKLRQSQEAVRRPQPAAEPKLSIEEILLRLLVVPLILAIVGIGITGWGLIKVSGAQESALAAEAKVLHQIRKQGPIIDGLGIAGANRAKLTAAYEHYMDAKPGDRYELGAAYTQLVTDEILSLPETPSTEVLKPAIAELSAAQRHARSAREDWRQTAEAFPGYVAVAVGFSQSP